MYVSVNIDLAVQIVPVILLVDLVGLNLNQPRECFQDQSYTVLVCINLNSKSIFTVTYYLYNKCYNNSKLHSSGTKLSPF